MNPIFNRTFTFFGKTFETYIEDGEVKIRKKETTNEVGKEMEVFKPVMKKSSGLDTFEFTTKAGERFQDVFDEMSKNVPDRTSTIEEKELAIEYIDRMLACQDISDDLKTYWQNKKAVIEMEIQNINNEKKLQAGGETVNEVWEEFSKFTEKYFELDPNLSMEDKFENRMTYYATYKNFCLRFLACEGLTEEQRAEYMRMMSNADRDVSNWQHDYQRYLNER